jgi:hypothetical protein
MIKTRIPNPTFSAPSGYTLAPAIKLNLANLNADGIEIGSIHVLKDNALEVTFHVDVYPLHDNINGYLEMAYPDIEFDDLTDDQYLDAVTETESHMYEWAIIKLIDHGIPEEACRNIKVTVVAHGYTPVEVIVQFLLQPKFDYSIDPWVSLVFSPSTFSNQLYASTSVIDQMRQHFSPANSGAMSLRKFCRELFYVFPWHFRWRKAALEIDIAANVPTIDATQFSFWFNHTSPSYFSSNDIKSGYFSIPLFKYPARPVI